jgi:hypothetical protein
MDLHGGAVAGGVPGAAGEALIKKDRQILGPFSQRKRQTYGTLIMEH